MWVHLRPDAVEVLKDKKAQVALARYFAVLQNKKPAKFMIAKRLAVEFSGNNSVEELWQKHASATNEFFELERQIDSGHKRLDELPILQRSYLNLKAEIAGRILLICHLCTHRCGANRSVGELGYCRCGKELVVSSIFEHMGEEPELVPSGTIFTMGCTMRCKHCQNWTISQWMETGEVFKTESLAKKIEELRKAGCRNINLVGGEPTPWLQQWFETFKHVKLNVPIVWNSNSYYSPETAKLLAGFADIYLLDFKYGSDECAKKISEAPNYWTVCTRNHLAARKFGELVIRALVLPNHNECCTKPIIDWIAGNLGSETRVNIMFQYRPEWRAGEIPEISRRLTSDEVDEALQMARKAGLRNFIT
jgi:putative pyruvate formate lyase activating enzyme